MAPGAPTLTKEMVASHTASARRAGMTDAMLSEVMAVVGMANETATLANGYQVEIDAAFRSGTMTRPSPRRTP